MAATRSELFAFLDSLDIVHTTYEHEPIFTVEQGANLKAQWPGGHSKNLFLKDKKGAFFLLSAKDDTEINLKRLPKLIACARLSFGNPVLMEELLGVAPGSVTAFALINDPKAQVRFLVDQRLLKNTPVHFHPLKNDATTAIAPNDLLKFARACGHEPTLLDLSLLDASPE